jgi:zinc protease
MTYQQFPIPNDPFSMTHSKSNIQNHKSFSWLGLLLATLVLVVVSRLPALAATAKHYTELEFAPLPEIQLPKYTRYKLDNGMLVYLMEDHELPLVGGTAMIRTGERLEPADKVGLASLVGEVMRTGGTTEHTGDELNQLLEQRAASVETGIGSASGSASFSALSEDLDTVFDLFAEVIKTPAFAQEKLDLAKRQRAGQIARRNDDPNGIAGREFQKLIYGKDSPYARTVEYQTLNPISREDLVAFYQQYVHPENMILGIIGDLILPKCDRGFRRNLAPGNPPLKRQNPPCPLLPRQSRGVSFW